MINKEKVIKELEICTSRPCYCTDCPYKKECCLDSQNVMKDALALLKEYEPRAMTPEEVKAYDGYCWFEKKNTMIMCVSLIKDGLVFDFGDPPYNVEFLNWPYYSKDWRCWSAQPIDEQRKAVKWE